jgi:hypothetical protein
MSASPARNNRHRRSIRLPAYERVIRHDRELNAVREYIRNNPLKWVLDRDNPLAHRRDQMRRSTKSIAAFLFRLTQIALQIVTLSVAKGLVSGQLRCFASLSMTHSGVSHSRLT